METRKLLTTIINPNKPQKAKVGKLYELRLDPVEIDADTPEYYVFDTRGNATNRTWIPSANNVCLVLRQEKNFTVVLVGEDIVHVGDDETLWQVELIPLFE